MKTKNRCYQVSSSELGLSEIMSQISLDRVPQWREEGVYWVPASVDAVCGFCNHIGNLVTGDGTFHSPTMTVLLTGRCTRCGEVSKVWAIGVKQKSRSVQACDEVWVLPKPQIREAISLGENVPKKIAKSYRDAITTFNAGMYSPSIALCGVIVEGIGKTTFPDGSRQRQIGGLFNSLKNNLKQTPEYEELLKPLLDIGEALRVGRNAGAHFDLEKDPDRDLTNKMIDLIEFLLKYIYVVSQEASEVEKKVDQLESDSHP